MSFIILAVLAVLLAVLVVVVGYLLVQRLL